MWVHFWEIMSGLKLDYCQIVRVSFKGNFYKLRKICWEVYQGYFYTFKGEE